MLKLREAIGLVDNLVFVSTRHKCIAYALFMLFLEAHHGACTYHMKININHKLKTYNLHTLLIEFHSHIYSYFIYDTIDT